MNYPAMLALILVSSLGEEVQSLDCPQSSISCVESSTRTVLKLLKEGIRRTVEENLKKSHYMLEELRSEWENALGLVLNDVDFAFQEFPEHAYLGLTQLDKSQRKAAQILDDKYARWVKNIAVVHTEIDSDVCTSRSSKIIGLPFALMMGKFVLESGKQSLGELTKLSKSCFENAEDGER